MKLEDEVFLRDHLQKQIKSLDLGDFATMNTKEKLWYLMYSLTSENLILGAECSNLIQKTNKRVSFSISHAELDLINNNLKRILSTNEMILEVLLAEK
jgi:hypothetical protein